MNQPRVAIAHDYLTQRGGAERVVLAMARAFPDAPIYTTLYEPEDTYPEFAERTIITSPLNRVRYFRGHHRSALPFLPFASSAMRIPDADVVIASSSGWAHGFTTNARTLIYCHSPARWLYRSDDYLGAEAAGPRGRVLGVLKPGLQWWDKRAASRADRYLANSTVIAERIQDAYGIDATVLFPPMGVARAGEQEEIEDVARWAPEGHYLVVSRLLPYKNVDRAIAAFEGRPEKLLIIGAGPMESALRQMAPSNVMIKSDLTDVQLRWAYAHSLGLLAPSYEDFGLTPLEGGMFGKPVAALRGGGYLDTVVEGSTGVFFDHSTAEEIGEAVDQLQQIHWQPEIIEAHTALFGEERFARALHDHVDELLAATT